MNIQLRTIILVAVVTASGIGCEQDQPNRANPAGSSGVEPGKIEDTTADGTGGDPADRGDSDTITEIGFPLLDEARRLDFIDPELTFPESQEDLDGRAVSMIGFMAPFDDLRNMRRCMVLPSYVGCKFCSPPSITQVVFVTQGDADDSDAFRFIESPCLVTGILRLSLPESEHEGKRQGFMYSIEDAVVTAQPGEAPKQAPGHESTPHQVRLPRLAPVAMDDLVREVADLIEKEPLRPIEFEAMSDEELDAIIRDELRADFPEGTRAARSRAFQLLGMLPEGADWIDTLAEFRLSRRVTATEDGGDRIRLLDSVPDNHPYVRLERVGEIAEALAMQHFPSALGESPDGDADDDARRTRQGLRQGLRTMTIYRFARANGIPAGARPPAELVDQSRERRRGRDDLDRAIKSAEFGLWEAVPGISGSFFIDAQLGETRPIADVEPTLARPPSSTMELFRPGWHLDPDQWRQDPVPPDFADDLMDSPPTLTDVLGIGGLAPLLTQWYSFEVAKRLASDWAGDRWAFWELPDGSSALLLETRWRDEAAALRFRETIPDDPAWVLVPHLAGSNRVQVMRADSLEALDRLDSAMLDAVLRKDG